MAQQGQVFPLAAKGADRMRWAFRYRVGGPPSVRSLAVDGGHVRLVVALAGGRGEVVQAASCSPRWQPEAMSSCVAPATSGCRRACISPRRLTSPEHPP
jgi:hypothetical protein